LLAGFLDGKHRQNRNVPKGEGRLIMRTCIAIGTGLAALMLAAAPGAMAQAGAGYATPKTSWGAPDLQGVWTNSSITRLSRPAGVDKLVLTPEEASALEAKDYNNVRTAAEKAPTDQADGAPEKGKPLPPVGNYNAVWVDPGSKIAIVNGEHRSSWIVEPADGKVPAMTEEGREKMAALRRGPSGGSAAARSYEGPESRSLGERCLVGFGGTGGPVMLNVLYNNQYQIVQSPDYVVIDVEMVHDARIIPLTKTRTRPDVIKPWLGDSIGWFEGDTLVVETRNVNPSQTGPVFISDSGKLIERFTRVSDKEILYEFTVDDPGVYVKPWRGQMPLVASDGQVYEYACHEGNYGLQGILAGAREQEKAGKGLELTPDSE
jgi:hypothetical protein